MAENGRGEEGHAWIMLMWVVTAVENQPKAWLLRQELAATNNKVIITQGLTNADTLGTAEVRLCPVKDWRDIFCHLSTEQFKYICFTGQKKKN